MKIPKKPKKQMTNHPKRDDTATIAAEIHGVTPRYVRMVRNGERNNDEILSTLMELQEGKKCLIQSIAHLAPHKQPIR